LVRRRTYLKSERKQEFVPSHEKNMHSGFLVLGVGTSDARDLLILRRETSCGVTLLNSVVPLFHLYVVRNLCFIQSGHVYICCAINGLDACNFVVHVTVDVTQAPPGRQLP
jgi:hypothetical protein